MALPDLNLLVVLDVLLREQSVTAAAKRLRLSPSAMSRSLARLREATGDPLLVRAGRALVATPRATAMRERVSALVHGAESVLRPEEELDLRRLERTFTVRTSDGFVESFGPALIARTSVEAPGVQLRFVNKGDKDSAPLRTGQVDIDTGVIDGETSPELRSIVLFRDRFVGVVRKGHALSKRAGTRSEKKDKKKITAAKYAAERHVVFSRRGLARGRIDEALAELGLERRVATIVGGFAVALSLARATDLIATVPERHTRPLREGMHTFALPFALAPLTISMLWHPRLDADAGHRWLRESLRAVVAEESAR